MDMEGKKLIEFKTATLNIFILFVLVVIFFNVKEILLNKLWIFEDALIRHYLPIYSYLIRWLKKGIYPSWCQSMHFGYPLIGYLPLSIFWQIFSIVLIKSSLAEIVKVTDIIIILGYFLGSIFMFFYLKGLKVRSIPALAGSIVFTFNGLWIDQLPEYTPVLTFIWLPIILLLIDRFFFSRKYFYIVIIGFIIAIQFFCGHFQFFLYSMIVSSSYYIFKAFIVIKGLNKKNLLQIRRLFLLGIFILAIGMGLTAIQLLPSAELFSNSARSLANYKDALFKPQDSLKLINLPEFIFPFFWGDRHTPHYLCLYIGLFVFIFSMVAFLDIPKKKYLFFYVFWILFSFLFALGNNFYFNRIIYILIFPGLKYFRNTYMAVLISVFFLSILLAIGINFLSGSINSIKQKHKIIIMGLIYALLLLIVEIFSMRNGVAISKQYAFILPNLGSIFLFFALFFVCKESLKLFFSAGLIVCILISYYIFVNPIIKFRPYENLFSEYENFKCLEKFYSDKTYFRINILNNNLDASNVNLIYGLDSISSRTTPFVIRRFLEYSKGSLDIFLMRDFFYLNFFFFPNLLKLTNTKYIIIPKDIPDTEDNEGIIGVSVLKANPSFKQVYEDNLTRIYLFKDYLPRSLFVEEALVLKDKQKILDTLKDPNFNPQNTVILEEEIPFNTQASSSPSSPYTLNIANYTPNKVEISLSSQSPGFLILLDTNYPGWKATLDNQPAKIYQADYLFRAVYIPNPGNHKITFIYQPKSFYMGAFISLFTLMGCVGTTVVLTWKQKKSTI
jgi:hypothetical protein